MDAPFASLPKSFCAALNSANKWFLSRMSVVMLDQVLLQGELLSAFVANPLFFDFMDLHVALQTVLGLEASFTIQYIALKSLLLLAIARHVILYENSIYYYLTIEND